MTETQIRTHNDHLDKISERGGHHIRREVEKRIENFGADIDLAQKKEYAQPEADRILGEIAKFNKEAHAELGNHADHDEVWKRSQEIAIERVTHTLQERDKNESRDAMLTLISMQALEYGKYDSKDPSSYAEIKQLLKTGSEDVREAYERAFWSAEEVGLCTNIDNADDKQYVFLGDTKQFLLVDVDNEIKQVKIRKKIEVFMRCSPEENDARLGKHMENLHKNYESGGMRGILIDPALTEATEVIQTGNYSNAAMDHFLGEFKHIIDTEKTFVPPDPERSKYQDIFGYVLSNIPAERLQNMYFSNDPSERMHLEELLRIAARQSNKQPIIDTLSKVYDANLLEVKKRVSENDTLAYEFVHNPANKGLLIRALEEIKPEQYATEEEYSSELDARFHDCLVEAAGMPTANARELEFAMYGRSRWEHKSESFSLSADPNMLINTVIKIKKHVETLGADTLAELRNKTGIVNFDYYSAEQLERMSKLISGDEQLIKHLQDGDVTTVFSDAKGDHNGAMGNTVKVFESTRDRTLYFEINQPSDFYRHSILLRNLGVADSTRVISTHGTPGAMIFGTETNNFAVGSRSYPGKRTYGLQDVKGVQRIANEFMQPSRGFDDPMSAYNRKRLILASCSQAAVPSMRVDYNKEGTHLEYVPGVSTADEFVRSANATDLDVYAANEPVAMQTEGVWFSYIKQDENKDTWSPAPIKHFSIDNDGQVQTEEVKNVQLWGSRR